MKKIIAILQARMSSSRLPGKVLLPILGKPMLERQIERIQRSQKIDNLIVATSISTDDNAIADLCTKLGVECFRGSLDDVLDRYYQAAVSHHPTHVVRLTGDCPLIDPQIIDKTIEDHLKTNFDYSYAFNYPDGLDTEVINFESLKKAWEVAPEGASREHVTYYIYNHPETFKIGKSLNFEDTSYLRWTVDHQIDFDVVTQVYTALFPKNTNFGYSEIMEYLNTHPEVREKNIKIQRNEGLKKSINQDKK